MNNKWFLRVSIAACGLAFIVIVLGAYVRLSDAGLGCPDWPGCFGQLTAPDESHEIKQALHKYPHLEVDPGKAWKEMIHRYFASTLGLLILIMAFLAWRNRHDEKQQVILPFILVGLVIFQGMLGMWTVTQLVRPTIVTLHLLMGLTTLSCLFWVVIRHLQPWSEKIKDEETGPRLKIFAKLAVLVLALQLFLGGWTSTNYVALHCPEFPTCIGGKWVPDADYSHAFVFFKDPTVNYEGGTLPPKVGVAVHFIHRVGALITTITLIALAIAIFRTTANSILRRFALLLVGMLTVQISLGIANVLLILPIPIAVSHNGFAALLLLSLILVNYGLNAKALRQGN